MLRDYATMQFDVLSCTVLVICNLVVLLYTSRLFFWQSPPGFYVIVHGMCFAILQERECIHNQEVGTKLYHGL